MKQDSFHYELGVFMFNALHPGYADINDNEYDIESNFISLIHSLNGTVRYSDLELGYHEEAKNHRLSSQYIKEMFTTDVEYLETT